MNKNNDIIGIDKRGREWEMFCDLCYYDMWCVRATEDKDFNSQLSFHFNTKIEAKTFAELILKAC